jgi:methanethiol S-methyltransferase
MFTRSASRQTGSTVKVSLLFLLYGVVHSILASAAVKQGFARLAGERARNGLYRPLYIGQSVLTTLLAAVAFQRLRDRDLYQVPKPWAWAFNLLQLAGIGLLLRALSVTGFARILGLPQLVTYLRGGAPPPEAAAQGPPLQALKHPEKLGPFRRVRHPENVGIMVALWAFPRMTVNRLALALWTSLYGIVGSLHEDSRLEGAYGAAFDRYRRATPMLVPRVGGPRNQNR